tara:strand:- start:280 stop:648 length:369 start_codon:yes stop_codon:yes gene_type:complete
MGLHNSIAINCDEQMVGYVIGKVANQAGFRSFTIADVLVGSDHYEALEIALDILTKQCLDRGLDLVTCWSCKEAPQFGVLKKVGFYARGAIPVISHKDSIFDEVQTVLLSKAHFSIGDSENI